MSVHDGHRARLDRKVTEYGFEALEPHEQLEHILFAVIPRGDTNAIAHRLLDRFITISGVINADAEELMEIQGVGNRTALFLTTLPKLLGIVERELIASAPPILDNMESIRKFVKTYFYGRLTESVYIFSLNSAYKLLASTKLSDGSSTDVFLPPAQAVKQAIRDNATAVIVAHNHPCGTTKPSLEDLTLTAQLICAFEPVGIEFLDSIVVAGGQCESVKENSNWQTIVKEYKPR